jgi:transposase InsO family protein
VNHLKNLIPSGPVAEGPPRRGFAGQRVEREQELVVRRHAVDVGQRLVDQGWNWTEAAEKLGLAPRTLRDWRHGFVHNQLRVLPLGRPILDATREQRNQVIRHIDELGPGIGLPSLRLSFPDLARAELEGILRRYRRVWRKLNQETIHVLHWTRPGAVWAIDFHGPRPLIDDRYPYLFAARDLSSSRQLLWLPVADMTARTVVDALIWLFAIHGAPLVVKSDNGSAFIAEAFRELSQESGVKILFSPPGMPRYNGSIEAGIGSLKSRTEQHAARQGHPGHWTWDDAEAARLEANATARPRGPLGPSPDQLWAERTPITEAERHRFSITVADRLKQIEADQGWPQENPKDDMHQRAMDREAIRLALVEHGYLYFTRRRIPLPITSKKVASIM